ncbi:MAG: hypothetical protein A2951_00520 [Candidatus Buchananbacteria bacterium RIFCSPLOWO2_01_FULL_56_15]|uniref:YbaK/aminoacyl-tRNA synthetase-associated domain-containing protein n=1 Tax=Candidatus Buchananbacteria bacterium RIFCSPLOWO2_01_FULL_56_15 TaxID=1797547 RepID=A0A1G1YRI1_9BACT|nr:MAG: hypothetical protein A2951_00520 [Candidatus Buchananbacteria bacterium RIFCSPLOWO2_01_FULL_56_15]
MAIPAKVKSYLDKNLGRYEVLTHKTVYTAYDAAQTLRRELKEIAKSLLIAADKAYIIAVIPAHLRLDLGKLKQSLKAKKISIPREQIMVKVFKVKPGAMTAFGGLHKVEVWADKSLLKTKDVILSAGSFTDSVRMKVKDFLQMEQAKLANFATRGGYKLQVKPAKKSKSSGKVKSKSR